VTSWDGLYCHTEFPSYLGIAISSAADASWTRGQVRGADFSCWYLDVREKRRERERERGAALNDNISLKENEKNYYNPFPVRVPGNFT
jgi:hypothetical protein